MTSVYEAQTTTALATYSLGSIAIYWGCRRALTLHLQKVAEGGQKTSQIPPPADGTRWSSKWITAAVLAGVTAIAGTLIFGLTWFASKTVQDLVYMVMAFCHTSLSTEWFIRKAFPRYVFNDSSFLLSRKGSLTMASIISMTSIALVYTGHQWAQSLLVAIATFAHTTGHMGPARSIRSQIKWIVLMPVGTASCIGLIMGGKWCYMRLTGRSSLGNMSSETEIASPEVALLITMFSSVMPLCIPGTLLATTLRYESKPGEPSTGTPLFRAGLTTYFLTLIALGGAELLADKSTLRALRGMHSVCVTSLPAAARLVILAKQKGVYDGFIGYTDDSESGKVVDDKAVKQADEEHAFAALSDEKNGLQEDDMPLADGSVPSVQ